MTLLRLGVCLLVCAHLVACARPSDQAAVDAVRSLRSKVVLLTMHLPPRNPITDAYDIGYGSGVVVASGAWGSDIVTVDHVVKGATHLRARFDDGHVVSATLVSQSADRDLALVRVKRANLPFAKVGSSAHLQTMMGEQVGLLGYPIPDEFDAEHLGRQMSFSAGRLSAIRGDRIEVMLTIIPGQSGGPIFALDTAQILGLAQSRFHDEKSIGFAIPSDEVRQFLHSADANHGF